MPYVTGNIYSGNDHLWNKSIRQLTIHAFPGNANSNSSFTYVDMLDENQAKIIVLELKEQLLRITSPAMKQQTRLEIVMDERPAAVRNNGSKVDIDYDLQNRILVVRFAPKEVIDVTVEYGSK